MRSSENTVLITGGGSGIGRALAERFYDAGNRVILVGRSAERLESVAAGRTGLETCTGDVSDPELADRLADRFGDVNVLINNAGIQFNYEFASEPDLENKIARELAVNFTAPLRLARAFLPGLRKQAERGPAALVNVTSGLALVPKASAPVYCPSKAALRSFSKILRWQLEGTGIRVFEVLPPLVDTAMTAGRGTGKISPEGLAREFWPAFLADRPEIYIGKSKVLRWVDRLAPALAERIMRRL